MNIGYFGNRGLSVLKTYTPELLVGTGILTNVVGVGMACKATLDATDILAEANENLKDIKSQEYEDEHEQDVSVMKEYVKLGGRLAKTYAPAVGLLGLSYGVTIVSAVNYRKQINTAYSAYAALASAFTLYRERVRKDQGSNKDAEYLTGGKVDTDENGNKTLSIPVDSKTEFPEFSRFFDESSDQFVKASSFHGEEDWSSEYNMQFLVSAEKHFDMLLKAKGYLFLNDVYEYLGFKRTRLGQNAGWLYNENHPDTKVDFGIFKVKPSEADRRFVNGLEDVILLTFNITSANIVDAMEPDKFFCRRYKIKSDRDGLPVAH